MINDEDFRKCSECGSPTAQVWIAHCSDYCRQICVRKELNERKKTEEESKHNSDDYTPGTDGSF
jgi:endogenous inhibitor of DNA gyrase (YacG/DUF329 family)